MDQVDASEFTFYKITYSPTKGLGMRILRQTFRPKSQNHRMVPKTEKKKKADVKTKSAGKMLSTHAASVRSPETEKIILHRSKVDGTVEKQPTRH